MSLRDAFESLLSRHSRSVTLLRRPASGPDISGTVKITPSNYFRNFQAPDNIVIEGREFIITRTSLEAAGFTTLRRGDIFQDAELGESVVDQIREMYDLGGAVIGYRCTTS